MVARLSTKVLNICIASMCKAKQVVKAEAVVIDGVRLGVLPDVVTYNTLIDAYCRLDCVDTGYSYCCLGSYANPITAAYGSSICIPPIKASSFELNPQLIIMV
ncbi:hypothetical protein AHAS_Ahas02G0160600 [Arachis hypogaea]